MGDKGALSYSIHNKGRVFPTKIAFLGNTQIQVERGVLSPAVKL